MFQTILCPVDFSDHSRRALRYAAAVAARFGGQVTVLSVTDPLLDAAARASSRDPRALADRSRAELSRFVSRAVPALTSRGRRMALVLAVGDPPAEILRGAKRLKSDLIVMGTEGLSGVRRVFFGSTTATVLQRARVPVLTVPHLGSVRVSARGLAVTGVIAPVELTGSWQAEASRAAEVARAFDVGLRLVHVVRPLQMPTWLRLDRDTDRERLARARATLERFAERLTPGNRTACTVVSGDPAREIARLTRRESPLVVMALRGGTGLWGRRGSIAYRVLTQSSSPVLALTT